MGRTLTLHDRVLPPFFPRVIAEAAVAAGASRKALFEGLGLEPACLDIPEARVSYAQLCALTARAQHLTNDPALAIHAGERVRLTSLGLLGAAVMSCATAGEALATLLRHWPSVSPGLQLGAQPAGDDRVCIEIEPLLALPCTEFLTDMVLVGLAEQTEFILGRPAPVLEARTINSAAPHRFQRLVKQMGVEVTFEAPRTEVVLDADVLRWPCVHAEPNTRALAERMHVQAMGTPIETDVDLVQRVEALLDGTEEGNPSVTEVARSLGTSTRTLRRMLQASGTSFRALRETALHRRALRLLQAGGLTQTQIADRLGYGDVRAFRRAFKRWTGGLTPTAVPRLQAPSTSAGKAPSTLRDCALEQGGSR